MGKPGRKPTPTKLKELRGNPGRRPLKKRKPRSRAVSKSKPPAWLDATAKAFWKKEAPKYECLGLLTETSLTAFAAYCDAYSRMLAAKKELKAFGGMTYETDTEKGGFMVRKHPAVSILEAAKKELKAFGSEFGFSPVAEERLGPTPIDVKDEEEEFLFGVIEGGKSK